MRTEIFGEIELQELDGPTPQRPLDEIQRSWLLRPTEHKKKKKYGRSVLVVLVILVFGITVPLTRIKTQLQYHHHHHRQPPPSNYTLALHMALNFFNAQRSGKLPEDNNVTWRGDSCLQDGSYPGSTSAHLVGGYYDGGDAIKTNFPMSFAMTMLSWSVIEYSSKYQAAGELDHVKGLIKWGTDYFLNTFDSNVDTIHIMVSQIGSGGSVVPNDHYCWMRPEDINYRRDVIFCDRGCPDLAAEMAAALASASIVFRDNIEYSQKLLHGAKTLYEYAESMKDSSKGMYWDELIWGGTWMYYATGDVAYLDRVTNQDWAERAGAFSRGSDYGVLSWDTKLVGAQLLLTRLRLLLGPGYPYEEMLRNFHNQIDRVMCSYLPYFNKFNRTKGGLIQLNHGEPHPLQYAANAAFLATLFSDYLAAIQVPGWYCGPNFYTRDVLRDFSRSQIDYILGKNPQNMSYVVGFGEQYPKHVHHRGASIPKDEKESCKGGWKWKYSKQENPNIIQGAMVGGPDKHDRFHDVRTSYNYTEPTLAGNAGLVAALIALSPQITVFDKNTLFSAIPPMYPATPPPPAPWEP